MIRFSLSYGFSVREDGEAIQIYQELAPQTRWRVGQRTQIEAIRMNTLKQFACMGTPVFEEQIYYKDTASALVCGEILPYEVFQLFTDTAEVKKYMFFHIPSGMDGIDRSIFHLNRQKRRWRK